MKQNCEDCQKEFEILPIIDGKRRNCRGRKYCFECSPFNNKNSYKIVNGVKQKKDVSKLILLNQMREIDLSEINWKEMQDFYDTGATWVQVREKFGYVESFTDRAIKEGYLKSDKDRKRPGAKHTPESKEKIRQARLKRLAENPNEKSWRAVQGKKSPVAEKVKEFLTKLGISFVEELQPLIHKQRYFSMDIAFPDKMVAWEINGNQHYDTDSNLKPYYQNRHDLIEAEGWTVVEIRYWNAFKEEFLLDLIKKYNLNDGLNIV